MLKLNLRNQVFVGVSLVVLMVVTRGHYTAPLFHLQDASWAVFFLAGVYVRPKWVFLMLCGVAVLIDWIAISWGGVSSFCVTPAYTMLLPAFASLWLGGRWFARHYYETPTSLLYLALVALTSALLAEIFSSGGFYFLGGRFAEPTFAVFLHRTLVYFPNMLSSMTLYLGFAVLVHVPIVLRRHTMDNNDTASRNQA